MQLDEHVIPKPRNPEPGSTRSVPPAWSATKRAMDLALGSALLVLSAPIIAVAAVGIVFATRGTPFFLQERVGQHGRHFKMVKLRTMVKGAHRMREQLQHLNEVDGPVFKIKNDPRLHPLGAFLRRTSIDELPNLLNVLKGDISLVGPRPPLPSEVATYDQRAMCRLSVPQGITCYWQISGRSNLSFDEWMEMDNRYIATWSPLVDLKILLKTVGAVVLRDGAH